jgi:hypothetical protein
MQVLKSVGIMSVAKITGLLYGGLGLLFAPFFVLFAVIGSFAGEDKTPFAGMTVVVGIVFAIMMPLFYGGMGFVMGAIGALLYNVLSKWVGGFELELEIRPAAPIAPYPLVPPPTPAPLSPAV